MLHNHEQTNGYVWSTIRPHLNLAYFPINSKLKNCTPENVFDLFPLETVHPDTDVVSCTNYHEDTPVVSGETSMTYKIHLSKLYLQCIEVGVISLQNMMLGEETRQVLLTEELVDFVVCMPWYLPSGSPPQIRAWELIRSLSTYMKLEPPSLANIARAKLATDTFGLERTLNAYSISDLSPS